MDFKIIYIPQLHERFEILVTTGEEDPNDVSKSITGTSLCEAELSQITLRNVQINTETDMTNPLYDENFPTILYRDPEEYDSVENLAIWEKSKYDYLKDKTAYPTEESVIARKKTILKHASLLHRVLEKAPHYSISCVADTLKKLKTVHEFTFDGTDILSALKDTIADDFHCAFMFNSENRTISVLDLYSTCNNCGYRGDYMDECPECGSNNITNKYGEDTNILINSTNLTTQITLDSNSDSLKNCFYITGADDAINAAIANVNPNGTQYIYYFSNGTLADMPTELQSKLRSYNTLYDEINTTREYNFKADRVAEYNKVINYINTKFASMSKDDQDKIEYPTLTSPLVGYPALTSAWYSAMDVYYFLNDSMMPVIDVDGMGLDDSITAIQAGLKDLGGVAVTGIKTITQSAVKGSVDALVKTFFSASYYDMDITDSLLSDYDSSTGKRTWSGTITLTSHSQMDENNQYLSKSVKITTDVIESTEKYIEQKITRMTNRADDIKDKQITSIKLAEDKFKEQLGYYSLVELNNLKKEFEACRDTTSGDLYANNANISGTITSEKGKIGKYTITGTSLWTGDGSTCTGIGGNQAFWAGSDSSNDAAFRVSYSGELVATNATISGDITATSGTIGGCSIADGVLKVASGNITSVNADNITSGTLSADRIGANSITVSKITTENLVGTNGWINLNKGTFNYGSGKLTWDGTTLSMNGTITTNNITATGGTIGGWSLINGQLCSNIEHKTINNEIKYYHSQFDTTGIIFYETDKNYKNGNPTLVLGAKDGLTQLSINTWKNNNPLEELTIDNHGINIITKNSATGIFEQVFSLNMGGTIDCTYLYRNGNLIGETFYGNSTTAKAIKSGSWSNTNSSLTLTPGVYIMTGTILFAASKGGRLGARFATLDNGFDQTTNVIPGTSAAATGYVQCQWIMSVTEGTKYYLQAWQSSGANVNVTASYMKAVRIA